MSSNSHLPLIYKKGKPNLLVEVANTDKQLVTLIHSKGLLCPEVQELYHRVCSSYEKILLNDYDQAELQDVEYSLWKLQYRHIDEFRKRIKKSSVSDNTMTQSGANVQRSSDNHIEGFKSFLSEAMAFYRNLLAVLATYVGDEFLALYHCVRSLAVKEPFPDAWNNLILLFERVRVEILSPLLPD
ncbi:hypothetical protein CUMW_012010 [Citrus unshiu]|nr:hypothetical protein CUMW_012010 [Citrus unshiu]GAY34538.1 hypothetical protein CUMW_012010 [Citrus unshiu]